MNRKELREIVLKPVPRPGDFSPFQPIQFADPSYAGKYLDYAWLVLLERLYAAFGAMQWRPASEPPKKEGQYLVWRRYPNWQEGHYDFAIARYSLGNTCVNPYFVFCGEVKCWAEIFPPADDNLTMKGIEI